MRTITWLALVLSLLFFGAGTQLQAATTVTMPGGGRLVVDPDYDAAGPIADVGRVQVYDGSNNLITTIRGTVANDRVGSGGAVVIGTDSFLIASPLCDNVGVVDAGAVTFGYVGINYSTPVSLSNSMMGSTTNDQLGSGGITKVGNDFAVVTSPLWDNPATTAEDAGAIIMAFPGMYRTGAVSATGALVGTRAGDGLGSGGVTTVGTSLYLIRSLLWDNGAAADAGAVTPGRTNYIPVGELSASNSLVGTTAGDQIGSAGITVFGTSRYLVRSPQWDNGTAADAGAVSPAFADYPRIGAVSAANSLVGTTAGDQIGSAGITTVGSTLYLVRSPNWDNGAAANAGAVSPSLLDYPEVGPVSASNSLIGTRANDQVGSAGITTIGSTVYLVRSPNWDNGAATNAGAVSPSFVDYPQVGVVSASNSLIGTTANDQVGSGGITTIGTKLYVVRSPNWDNGAATNAGAVSPSFVDYPQVGVVSGSNSLMGTTTNDQVGSGSITTIGTKLYLVHSPNWDNGAATNAGAVSPSFVDYPQVGVVSASNSLIGTRANDQVGSGGITTIGTTLYLVRSPLWDNGAATDAGAVSQAYVDYPQVGAVSASNSLIGSATNDQVGSGGITTIGTTAYLVHSPQWDHSVATDAGAVSYGSNDFFNYGVVSLTNSLVGSHVNDQIGSGGITVQGSTGFTITSPNWCYGAGATTTGNTTTGVFGVVSSLNSTVGAESHVPEMAVLQPAPTEVASNASRDYGGVTVGSTQGMTFVIQNTGMDDLRLTGATRVARSGTDAALFSVVAQPPSVIVAGGSFSFTLNFTPTTEGGKTAQISITNNDSNENPYRVNLTGTALSQVAGWRQTHFGSSANTGNAADDADYDKDGIPNLVEYALGLHPAQSTTGQLPVPAASGGNFGLSFSVPAGISGVTYGAEWSPSLVGGNWLPVTDTGTPPQHLFSVPTAGNGRVFMRLKIQVVP